MKKIFWIVLLVLVAYLAWRWWRGPGEAAVAADHGEKIFYNRVWVDHLPTSQTDAFDLFAAVNDESIGVFDHRSQWKGQWEMFRWEPRGDGQLDAVFPGSKNAKTRMSYRAWKCSDKRALAFLEPGNTASSCPSPRGSQRTSSHAPFHCER